MNTNQVPCRFRNGMGRMVRRICSAGIALGMTTLMAAGTAYANDDHRNHWNGAAAIEGTWVVAVDPPDNIVPTHFVLASFSRGGVLNGSTDPYLPPAAGNAGYPSGNWIRTGRDQYASTMAALSFDSAGKLTGYIRIDSEYQITDDDKLVGRARLNICDLSLQCTSAGPGTATLTGTRLPISFVGGTTNARQEIENSNDDAPKRH